MNDALTKKDIDQITDEIISLYRENDIPWIVGYSGGKDSTATLQLVWNALKKAKVTKKDKTVHVITVDTMVESPVVSTWVGHSLKLIQEAAEDLPIQVHILKPDIQDTYWVNLLGRGYPFPKTTFRWCTDRLKIKPSNTFVQDMVALHGEVIMVMGTRKAESAHRQQTLTKFEKLRTKEHLNPSTTLSNAYFYPVLENWSNDNVWQYLMLEENPWGNSNKELLTMYKGATADGECPLVVSTDTPSCGSSRFGCWVCTLVEKDKSMAAMIMNDSEKEWMLPLLNFRNKIGTMSLENERRDFRRMNGKLTLSGEHLVHGPYKKEVRESWLEELLQIQEQIRQDHTCPVDNFTVITDEELQEIRRIWLYEKHQFDDTLPLIYKKITGRRFEEIDNQKKIFGKEEWDLLKEITEDLYPDEELLFELQTYLLDSEIHSANMRQRRGILLTLMKVIEQSFYKNEADAYEFESEIKRLEDDCNRIIKEPAKTENYEQIDMGEFLP